MNAEWRQFMVVTRTRDRFRAHLLTKIMEQSSTKPSLTPREIALQLFDTIDQSNSGYVSKEEFKKGLDLWDMDVSAAAFDRLWEVINVNGTDQMQRQEWVDFMSASDEDLEGKRAAKKDKDKDMDKSKDTAGATSHEVAPGPHDGTLLEPILALTPREGRPPSPPASASHLRAATTSPPPRLNIRPRSPPVGSPCTPLTPLRPMILGSPGTSSPVQP